MEWPLPLHNVISLSLIHEIVQEFLAGVIYRLSILGLCRFYLSSGLGSGLGGAARIAGVAVACVRTYTYVRMFAYVSSLIFVDAQAFSHRPP